MSKTASWHNGYCESGFVGKRVHADAVDCWRVAIDDPGPAGQVAGKCDEVTDDDKCLVIGFDNSAGASVGAGDVARRPQRAAWFVDCG